MVLLLTAMMYAHVIGIEKMRKRKKCLNLITQTVHVGNCLTFIHIYLGKIKLSQTLNTSKEGVSKVKTVIFKCHLVLQHNLLKFRIDHLPYLTT